LFNFLAIDVNTVSTTKYNHYAMIQPENDICFSAEAKVDSSTAQYFRWNSIKTQAVTISSNSDGFIDLEYTGIANDLEIAGAGNFYGDAAAIPEYCGRIPFGAAKCWLTTSSAATITTDDHKAISNFTLTMSRPLERDFAAQNSAADQWSSSEPTIAGLQSEVCMLSLEFNGIETYTYFTSFRAETEYKLILQWDDGVITDIFKLAFPRLKMVAANYSADSPGRIPFTIDFQGIRATSLPDGFTAGEVDPVIVTVQNTEDTKDFCTGAVTT